MVFILFEADKMFYSNFNLIFTIGLKCFGNTIKIFTLQMYSGRKNMYNSFPLHFDFISRLLILGRQRCYLCHNVHLSLTGSRANLCGAE
jgi:hypothetical protein